MRSSSSILYNCRDILATEFHRGHIELLKHIRKAEVIALSVKSEIIHVIFEWTSFYFLCNFAVDWKQRKD